MPTQTFCTIITAGHLPFARVLQASLKQNGTADLKVLVVEDAAPDPAIDTITVSELYDASYFRGIEKKYRHSNTDNFRWSLKPVLIGHLLDQGYDKVIFIDPDIYFVNRYQFLFDMLDKASVLLTPHWVNLDLTNNGDSVLAIMTNGVFNAGFVAAGKSGRDAMNWWAGMCHYKMERSRKEGIYDDQKYLDVLPAQFNNVQIVQHQGCNLASWNMKTCKRLEVDGRLLINGVYEPVFIHFTKETIENILNRNDALLKPYLDEYIKTLSRHGFDLLKNLDNMNTHSFGSAMYAVKHQLRIRTRIKQFLFRLAEKL